MVDGEEYGEICRAVHDATYEGAPEDPVDQEIVELIATLIAWREERRRGYSLIRAKAPHHATNPTAGSPETS